MKWFVIPALAAVLALCVNAAADLSGTWKGSMETPMGKTEVTITVDPGAALTGKVALAEYGGAIENARVEGDRLSFEVNIEHGKLVFEGTVAGDAMKYSVTGTRGDQYSLVCNRQK